MNADKYEGTFTQGMSQCGGYSTTLSRMKRQFVITFFCGTVAIANTDDATSVSQSKFDKMCDELILNHICMGRPTGVLGLLPDIR